jgi:outer membrane protein assembly factor BamB
MDSLLVSRRSVLRSAAVGSVSAGFVSSATAGRSDASRSTQTYGGTVGNTFYDGGGSGPRDDLSVAWSIDLGGIAIGVVDERGIYAAGERLVALDEDGSVRWEREPAERSWQLPSLGEEYLYASDRNEMQAIDPESGEVAWSVPVETNFAEIQEVGDTAYCLQMDFGANGRERLSALDRDIGDERWSESIPSLWFVTPMEDAVYGATDGSVVALDPGSGSQRWQFEADDIGTSIPAVSDGVVHCAGEESIYAIDGGDGTEQWSVSLDIAHPRVLVDVEAVYGSTEDGIVSLDAETGVERWTTDDIDQLLAGVGDTLYAIHDNLLLTVNRSDGAVVDRTDQELGRFTTVSVSNGTAYLGAEGQFFAIEGTSSSPVATTNEQPSTADNASFGGSDGDGQPGLGVLSALGGIGVAAVRLLRRDDGDA